jgi:hypothetical protein
VDRGPRLGPAAAATCRCSRHSTTAPTRSSSTACAPSGSRWAARRTRSRPPTSSPAAPAHRQRPCRPADAPRCTPPLTRRHRRPASADGSASTSPPNHQQPQTLEPFFLPSLAGFVNAQRRRPRAATPADNAGHPQVSRTTASFSLIATKKLEGTMWRAAQLLGQLPHMFTLNKPVIPVYDVTLICTHICVQKYTSVYSLPLPNSFLAVIRSFHSIRV